MTLALPDLAAVATMPAAELPALLAQLAALQAAVAAQLLSVDQRHAGDRAADDHLLGIEAAAERLAVTPDWLRRRGKLPFVVKLSDGVVRYSAAGIAQFIAASQRR